MSRNFEFLEMVENNKIRVSPGCPELRLVQAFMNNGELRNHYKFGKHPNGNYYTHPDSFSFYRNLVLLLNQS